MMTMLSQLSVFQPVEGGEMAWSSACAVWIDFAGGSRIPDPAPAAVFAPVLEQGCEAGQGPCGHGEINVPKRRRGPGWTTHNTTPCAMTAGAQERVEDPRVEAHWPGQRCSGRAAVVLALVAAFAPRPPRSHCPSASRCASSEGGLPHPPSSSKLILRLAKLALRASRP